MSETVTNVAWVIVLVFSIHSFTIYSVVRLLVTGKGIFERKSKDTVPSLFTKGA